MGALSRSQEIMAAVRELAGPGLTQREIAAKAATTQGRVCEALALLRRAPDLADAVST